MVKEKRKTIVVSCRDCRWKLQYKGKNNIDTLEKIWQRCPKCLSIFVTIEREEIEMIREVRRNVTISCEYCTWKIQYESNSGMHTLEQIWNLCPVCFSSAIDIETGEQVDEK